MTRRALLRLWLVTLIGLLIAASIALGWFAANLPRFREQIL